MDVEIRLYRSLTPWCPQKNKKKRLAMPIGGCVLFRNNPFSNRALKISVLILTPVLRIEKLKSIIFT